MNHPPASVNFSAKQTVSYPLPAFTAARGSCLSARGGRHARRKYAPFHRSCSLSDLCR